MTDRPWVPVLPVADVTGPPWPCRDVEGVPVRILRDQDGQLHAIGAACPHLDAPLDRAEVEGDTILCPRHWYAYDTTDGGNVHPGLDWQAPLDVYPVMVEDGVVHVAPVRET